MSVIAIPESAAWIFFYISFKITQMFIPHSHSILPLINLKLTSVWTTRGAGLTRVLAAIRLRAGTTVKLVFESSRENATKAQSSSKAAAAADNARAKAQAKKDTLLKQLEKDDQKLNKKFFGLF